MKVDWQLIETAPKNEYGEAYGPWIIVWYEAYPQPAVVQFHPSGSKNDNGPGWFDVEGEEYCSGCINYWIPMLDPPERTRGEQ